MVPPPPKKKRLAAGSASAHYKGQVGPSAVGRCALNDDDPRDARVAHSDFHTRYFDRHQRGIFQPEAPVGLARAMVKWAGFQFGAQRSAARGALRRRAAQQKSKQSPLGRRRRRWCAARGRCVAGV